MIHPLVYLQAQSISGLQDTAMLVSLGLMEGCKYQYNAQVLLKKVHGGLV